MYLPEIFKIDESIRLNVSDMDAAYNRVNNFPTNIIKIIYALKGNPRALLVTCGTNTECKIHYDVKELRDQLKDEFYVYTEIDWPGIPDSTNLECLDFKLINLDKTDYDEQKIMMLLNAINFM